MLNIFYMWYRNRLLSLKRPLKVQTFLERALMYLTKICKDLKIYIGLRQHTTNIAFVKLFCFKYQSIL